MATHKNALLRVLACRPVAHNTAWCHTLVAQGYQVINQPLLEITPVDDPTLCRAIQTCMLDIDQYNPIIFVSQNAVTAFFEQLDRFWAELIHNWVLIGVGEATRQALVEKCEAFGGSHAVTILGGCDAMNTEALLSLPELSAMQDKKVLICRGVGGRPRLGTELEKRGARVSYCELYRRDIPNDIEQQLKAVTFNSSTDCLAFFSGETYQNFMQAIQSNPQEKCTAINKDIRVVVPSERVYNLVSAAGFTRVILAKNATEAAMLNAIKQSFESELTSRYYE